MQFDEAEEKARVLGRIKLEPLQKAFGKIQTDEIILTTERIVHIMERHPDDYNLFQQYAVVAVTQPDVVIKDNKNKGTIFMVKKLSETNINVVVRVALSMDKKGLKNFVMTFYRLRNKNLNKLLERNEVLYKRE